MRRRSLQSKRVATFGLAVASLMFLSTTSAGATTGSVIHSNGASAKPSSGQQKNSEGSVDQGPLLKFARSIQRYSKSNGHTGYVQASLGATPGKLTIFWHGPVPAEVAKYTQSLGSSNSVVFTQ